MVGREEGLPHLYWRPAGVVGHVGLVGGVGQAGQPADVGLGAGPLRKANGVPDTRQPMSDEGEGRHEQDENSSAILGVAVNFSRHPNQAQQAGSLQ